MARKRELAGIEYSGIAGVSHDCQTGVERLLQFGHAITQARILSFERKHCLILTNIIGDLIGIKSGFSSGYGGEGPRRLSYALQLLKTFGVEIVEYTVDETFIARLDSSALTVADLKMLESAKPTWPIRWHEYINDDHYDRAHGGTLLKELPPVIPFSIIDSRIVDLAISFWGNPDDKLLTGYRRLEDRVRGRTGASEHGAKLFSRALSGPSPSLIWRGIDEAEKNGRTALFTGAYMAHRNPRAHKELKIEPDKQLSEFLLLNHLFRLESALQDAAAGSSTLIWQP